MPNYDEYKYSSDYQNLKRQADAESQNANAARTAMDNVDTSNTYQDAFIKNVNDYIASKETPEMAAARQKDQRRAAMWTAVTDGINHIFNLTHASTNNNAVPMNMPSTSEAVQKSAQQADERYERDRDKIMALNQQLSQMRSQEIAGNKSDLRNRYQDAFNASQAARASLSEYENRQNEMYRFEKGIEHDDEKTRRGQEFQANEAAKERAFEAGQAKLRRENDEDQAEKNHQRALELERERNKNKKTKFDDAAYNDAIGKCTQEQRTQIDSIVQRDIKKKKKQKKAELSPEEILEIKRNAVNAVNPGALGEDKETWDY